MTKKNEAGGRKKGAREVSKKPLGTQKRKPGRKAKKNRSRLSYLQKR
jgi:hypothetical protein